VADVGNGEDTRANAVRSGDAQVGKEARDHRVAYRALDS
jgi:hypothetical protein